MQKPVSNLPKPREDRYVIHSTQNSIHLDAALAGDASSIPEIAAFWGDPGTVRLLAITA